MTPPQELLTEMDLGNKDVRRQLMSLLPDLLNDNDKQVAVKLAGFKPELVITLTNAVEWIHNFSGRLLDRLR